MALGKWLGGGIGWALGGPVGALLGFAVGSLFDSISDNEVVQNRTRTVYRKTGPGDFAASLVILAAAVMKTDERILKSELEFVKQFFVRIAGEERARNYILLLREILKRDIDIAPVCLQIKANMDISSRLQLIHFLFGISQSDGHVHPKEADLIHHISRLLGISENDFVSIKAMFYKTGDGHDLRSAFEILEIKNNASLEEIKSAYRRMAMKYHPDKVSHLGEEYQKAANEKFKKVNDAYERIKKEKGMI